MKIYFVIINFVLLAVLLWYFGRKLITGIFSKRRNLINAQIDETERLQKENEAFSFSVPEIEITDYDALTKQHIEEIENRLAQTLADMKEDTERKKKNLRREMLAELKETVANEIKKRVRKLLTEEKYTARLQANHWDLSDKILDLIRLTPGDMAYLKTKNVLYVTLSSAFPLDETLVKKIEKKTDQVLASVGGKSSFWVRENRKLLGGFELKIGDTVYGCSVDDELYYLGSLLRKKLVTGDETVRDILDEANDILMNTDFDVRTYQRGRVISVSDGICWMDGLADIMYGEVVEFTNGLRGMVLDIKQDQVGCIIYGSYERIESGTAVRRVGRIAAVSVGDELLGRVVDPMGNPLDGEGRIWASEKRPIELAAPGIPQRKSVSRPLHTGIKAIDAMVPIGKGQRELVIGDRQTGKSAVVLDTIAAQKGRNVPCIYVAIGQKESTIAKIRQKLSEIGAMEYTTIVSASASSSAAMQYIAPFAGCAMAEYFMYSGRDALVIYDDLSKHAVAYRELSLLLHRPAGREAYPGDVFYLHARLLERAAQLSDELGGGSLTALPLIETQAGDISAYIPTNVISITDGQIFLESELFNEGQRPAVNVGLSVSRVGGAAQTPLMKQTASLLRMQLAQYRELEAFAQFGTELDATSKAMLEEGALMMAALKQGRYSPLEDWQESLILFAVQDGAAKGLAPEDIPDYEKELYVYMESSHPELTGQLKSGKKLDDKTKEALRTALAAFREAE